MPDATIKRLDEMESFYDGLVTRARAELGVTSWGIQVFDLPPHFDQYPNHHHGEGTGDPGQEEVYIPLAGSATLVLDGEQHRLEAGAWARSTRSASSPLPPTATPPSPPTSSTAKPGPTAPTA